MTKYVLKRLLSAFIVLFFVTLITFISLELIPGDSAVISLGLDLTSDSLEALRASMGLNEPLYIRYFKWVGKLFSFDLGTSAIYGSDVKELIISRLPVTFSLTIFSILIAVIMSSILGLVAAVRKGSIADGLIRTIVLVISSLPSFWISLIALIFLCGKLGWFPVSGYTEPSQSFSSFINSIALPSIILALGELGLMTRMFRTSIAKTLKEDYMLAPRIKGINKFKALTSYAGRSAIIAPITVIGNQAAKLFGGTIVVETIFSLPGIGRLLLVAVEQRDVALLQGVVLFITTMVVAMNFLTDIAVAIADPLIRKGLESAR